MTRGMRGDETFKGSDKNVYEGDKIYTEKNPRGMDKDPMRTSLPMKGQDGMPICQS